MDNVVRVKVSKFAYLEVPRKGGKMKKRAKPVKRFVRIKETDYFTLPVRELWIK